jgi:hypothetical protein
VKQIGGDEFVDPQCEGTDDNLGAFMMFVLRDALTYCGLLPEKKAVPAWEHKLATYKHAYYNKKAEYLSKVVS